MPYITQEARDTLDNQLKDLGDFTPGELNYIITKLINDYLVACGINYTNLNMIVGVLGCVSAELYRCVIIPYEKIKEFENGGVYSCLENLAPPPPEPEPELTLDDVKESSLWTETTTMGNDTRTFLEKSTDTVLEFPWDDEEISSL